MKIWPLQGMEKELLSVNHACTQPLLVCMITGSIHFKQSTSQILELREVPPFQSAEVLCLPSIFSLTAQQAYLVLQQEEACLQVYDALRAAYDL